MVHLPQSLSCHLRRSWHARRPCRLLGLLRPFGVAALVGSMVAGCTGVPTGITPVQDFDPDRFMGTWYEIMRLDHGFEDGLTNVRATYRPNPDGSVAVFNRAWNPDSCTWETISGTARLKEGPDVGSFVVTLRSPIPGALHVLTVDDQAESWAMTGGPTRDYLWILSRDRTMADDIRRRLMQAARDMGYPVEDLIRVDQSGPVCRRP